MALRISALVPSLNEEATIETALRGLRGAGIDQVIVADGGSHDGTVERARPLADRVLLASGGLFAQLNEAAREADGDVLLFHYADVELPASGREAILRAIERDGASGGAFTLGFSSERRCYKVIAAGARLRNRLGVGPFGDQSIFARTDVFRRLGGFAADVVHADFDFVRRLRREGRFVIVEERVKASVRRWERNGVFPMLLVHWWQTLRCVVGKGKRRGSAIEQVERLRTVR